jgi:hypothetical protein
MPIDYELEPDLEDAPSGYWAAVQQEDGPKDKIAAYISGKIRQSYEALDDGGFIDLYRLTHCTYYGLDGAGRHTSSRVIEFGEQGEKLGVRANHMRSLVRYIHLTATQNQPAIKPRANNSTPKALAQIPAARRVLEYYDKAANVKAALSSCALRCLLYGKGYIWQAWDPFAGPIAAPPDNAPAATDGAAAEQDPNAAPVPDETAAPATEPPQLKPTGDLIVRAGDALSMACDLDVEMNQHDWFAARVRRNRYDQIALYATLSPEASQDPEAVGKANDLREQLLAAPRDILSGRLTDKLQIWNRRASKDRSDSVFEYHFMHRKTAALPKGRYTIITGDNVVLFDGPLPYDTLPVKAMVAEEFLEMGDVGYSSAWDLLGLQNIHDAAFSIAITNMDAMAQNDILIPEGVEIGVEEIRDGLNVIRYPMGDANKPEVLEKFSVKKELFELMDRSKSGMETIVGVNSVARGEPQASLESGSALALVQAQAVTFQAPFVKAYSQLVGETGTDRIKILQRHLPADRVLAIAGSDDPDSVKEFSTPSIDQIDRIDCEDVNPLFATSAGKQNAADKLLERGLITDPHQYVQFHETGRIESVTDDARRKDLFGRRVREILMTGPEIQEEPGELDPMTGMPGEPKRFIPACRYVIVHDPRICMAAAGSVLASFDNMQDEKIVLAATTYMNEVLSTWRATDPDTLELLGYPLPNAAIMRANPMAAQASAANKPAGGPPKPGAPKPGAPKPPAAPGGAPARKPADQQAPAEGSGMPSLPKPAESPL